MVPKLRVARPTNELAPLVRFYRDGLGMVELGSFQNHAGFDGVMLGQPNAPYHLEFTRQQGHLVSPAPTPEHLLVFYFPSYPEWVKVTERLQAQGYAPVTSHNPYWDQHGLTFADPDGYRVVLQHASWEY